MNDWRMKHYLISGLVRLVRPLAIIKYAKKPKKYIYRTKRENHKLIYNMKPKLRDIAQYLQERSLITLYIYIYKSYWELANTNLSWRTAIIMLRDLKVDNCLLFWTHELTCFGYDGPQSCSQFDQKERQRLYLCVKHQVKKKLVALRFTNFT